MALHMENDEDAGKILEKMMEKFEIDLGDDIEETENATDELNKLRKRKNKD